MKNSLRVSFINTSSKQNNEPFRIIPLGSLLLLTILEQEFDNALDLSFIDLRKIAPSDHVYHIPERDIYLHYVTTPEVIEISENVRHLRKIYPQAVHFAGGPHCNIFPEESQKIFDSICLGEGEQNITLMIQDFLDKKLKKLYRKNDDVDINQYPYPSRKYLPKRAIADYNLLSAKHADLLTTSVLFSRGCPFNCHFCSNQYPGRIRFRKPELITAEIEYLKKEYDIKGLLLKDDNGIPIQEKQAVTNIEAIARTNIKWRCQTRANGVSTTALKLAKEAGCVEIAVAIESVHQESLDIMNKKINLDKARKYIEEIKKTGMDVKVLLIIGLPGEPKNIGDMTIKFINEIRPSNVSLSMLCPIPGSEIYNNPKRFGMKINSDVPFDKYLFAFGRFDGDEKTPRFFEYEAQTPFGPSLTTEEILASHHQVQEYLRTYNINF